MNRDEALAHVAKWNAWPEHKSIPTLTAPKDWSWWNNDNGVELVHPSLDPITHSNWIAKRDEHITPQPATTCKVIDWSKAPEWADRVVRLPGMRHLYWADDTQRQSVEHGRYRKDNDHVKARWEVVERRPITNIVRVDVNIKPTKTWHPIEQRIASLRALEKQVEETRAELTRDLEALGLTWMVRDEPEQPTITDWRDLRVGDVIECIEPWGGFISHGDIGTITRISNDGVISDFASQNGYKYEAKHFGIKFRFMRRP